MAADVHDHADLVQHAMGEMTPAERARVETHLAECPSCREFSAFVREFSVIAREAVQRVAATHEPCPGSATLVALEADELSPETAGHVRAHILSCTDCLDEFYLLRQATDRALSQTASSWDERFAHLAHAIIDLAKRYGPGTNVGVATIIAETPAFAARQTAAIARTSKVVEISIGQNTYTINLAVQANGQLWCDVAGFRTPREASLKILAWSSRGEELFSANSDKFGNSRFFVPRTAVGDGVYLLELILDELSERLPLRVPVT